MTQSVASMATFPERYEVFCEALRTLSGQFDWIIIYFNGYDEVPPMPELPAPEGIVPLLGKNHAGDLGASGKHYARRFLGPDTVLFTVDDDIRYPPDYRRVMERHLARDGGVVAVHGAKFSRTSPRSYLKDRVPYPYQRRVPFAKRIHVPGTGTMAYRVGDLAFDVLRDMPEPNMDDPQFAVLCEQQRVPRIVVPHESDWLQAIPHEGFKIWKRYLYDDEGRSQIVRSIRWKKL